MAPPRVSFPRLLAGLALLAMAACSSTDEPPTTDLPDGVVLHLDQSRVERKGREVFVRVENGTTQDLTVEAFTLTSKRFPPVEWSGDDEVGAGYEADLELDLPHGTCGASVDASVRLTYRVGNGESQTSTAPADDPYGATALLLDRDCAQSTFEDAASLEVGEPTITGSGRGSVLRLPVTLTPTGDRDDVRFGGFGSTVLFAQAQGSPGDVDVPLDAPGSPARVVMAVVPARCDPHALAEDKVGTLFDVRVDAPGLSDDAAFYLPLSTAQRTALFDFFRSHCGLD